MRLAIGLSHGRQIDVALADRHRDLRVAATLAVRFHSLQWFGWLVEEGEFDRCRKTRRWWSTVVDRIALTGHRGDLRAYCAAGGG